MLFALVVANLKMLVRDRMALFWALAFPLIFVVIFGLFRLDEPPTTTIAVVDNAQDALSQALLSGLGAVKTLKLEPYPDEAQAHKALADGKVRFALLIPAGLAQSPNHPPLTLLYDRSRVSAPVILGVVQRFVDEMNLQMAGVPRLLTLRAEPVQSRQLGYFDFLLPGLVGMAVMQFSIIGMAVVMASYREQKILKRLLTTPLSVRTFFTARVVASLVLALVQAGIILAVGDTLFNAHIRYGSLGYAVPLILLGNIVFLHLGFVAGAFSRSVNAASGLGNAIAMPMMFFSGVFFETSSLPKVLAVASQYLPLTPLLDALRGVLLEGKPFWAYPGELGILGAWVVISGALAVRFFRFQ
ncbi:Inner membrane transport permease YbhS [bacterium HR23]|nr:Inner membrane transport permease YbhS [bacterium HR23]